MQPAALPIRAAGRRLFAAAVPALLLPAVSAELNFTRLLSPIDWAIVCTLVGLAPCVLSVRKGTFDTFEPIVPMMAYLGFIFGLRGVYLLSTPFNRLLPFASDTLVATALSLATLGMLGMYSGYLCGLGDNLARHLPRLRLLNPSDRRYARSVIACATILGVSAIAIHALLLWGIIIYDVSSIAGTFWLSPFFNLLPLVICLVFLNGEGRGFRIGRAVAMFALYGLICLSFAWFAGKSSLLRPLFYLLVIFHYRRRMVSPVVLGFLALGFVVADLAALCRASFDWDLAATAAFLFAPSHSWDALWQLLFSRFYDLDVLVVIVARVRHSGLLLGQPYSELFFWFVPRFFWASKPLTWSYQWSHIFADYTNLREGSFVATTLIGDFYLNFGLWGLFLGSVLVGAIARMVYVYLIRLVGTKSAILLYSVVLLHLVIGLEQGVPELVALLVTDTAAAMLLLAACSADWRRREREEFAWLATAYPEVAFRYWAGVATGSEVEQR